MTSKSWEMPAAPSLRAPDAIAKREGTRVATLNQRCGGDAYHYRSATGVVAALLYGRFPVPACHTHVYMVLFFGIVAVTVLVF